MRRQSAIALSEEQKAAFWRDGFLPVHDLLMMQEVEALRRRTNAIILGDVPFPAEYLQPVSGKSYPGCV